MENILAILWGLHEFLMVLFCRDVILAQTGFCFVLVFFFLVRKWRMAHHLRWSWRVTERRDYHRGGKKRSDLREMRPVCKIFCKLVSAWSSEDKPLYLSDPFFDTGCGQYATSKTKTYTILASGLAGQIIANPSSTNVIKRVCVCVSASRNVFECIYVTVMKWPAAGRGSRRRWDGRSVPTTEVLVFYLPHDESWEETRPVRRVQTPVDWLLVFCLLLTSLLTLLSFLKNLILYILS